MGHHLVGDVPSTSIEFDCVLLEAGGFGFGSPDAGDSTWKIFPVMVFPSLWYSGSLLLYTMFFSV